MKKGLTITLLTVAFAVLGFQAMAIAPTISDIQSPIVGNADVTAPNTFVYPDAINLDSIVSDDTSPTAKILWSYEEVGTKYKLNGIDPINGTDAPGIEYNPGAKNIAASVAAGELNLDSNPRTITIRNSDLSPLGGATTTPAATGIVAAQTGTITLTASDGSSFSQKDLVIYTDNGGLDRISGQSTTGGTVVYNPNVKDGSTKGGFTYSYFAGSVTASNSSTTGICMETAALGDNESFWVGTAFAMPLAKNSVYDIALKMTSSNVATGHTPFWDMALDNNDNAGDGLNLYGADCYFMDNENGANSAIAAVKTFHLVWTPLAAATDQWNGAGAFTAADNVFTAAHAAKKDGRFIFRTMDIVGNGNNGVKASVQFGTICVQDLSVTKYDLSGVKLVSNGYTASTFVTSGSGQNCAYAELAPGATTVTTGAGGMTIAPTTAGKGTLYTTFYPGDATNDPGNPAGQADNYPVVCAANTIYRITYSIAAVDANSAANPPDAFYIAADTPTNEVIYNSFVTNNLGGCAMPKTGAAQSYVAFYHSNFGTASAIGAPWQRMRPYFTMANLPSLGFQGDDNSGSVTISSIKVDAVTLK